MGKRINDAPKGILGSGIPFHWLSMLIPLGAFVVHFWTSSGQKHAAAVQESVEPDSKLAEARANLFSPGGGSRFAGDAAKGDDRSTSASGRNFADAAYWDSRYAAGSAERYDWYGTWNSQSELKIRPHALPFMPPHSGHILQIGCGNSRLAEELTEDGYKSVVNIDFSQAVIERMTRKLSGVDGISFLQMDASAMTFAAESFDAVFEKGTLDAVYAGSPQLIKKIVAEVFRVLRPGGLFVSVSTGIPETRKDLNATGHSAWTQFRSIPFAGTDSTENKAYHLYLMTKAK